MFRVYGPLLQVRTQRTMRRGEVAAFPGASAPDGSSSQAALDQQTSSITKWCPPSQAQRRLQTSKPLGIPLGSQNLMPPPLGGRQPHAVRHQGSWAGRSPRACGPSFLPAPLFTTSTWPPGSPEPRPQAPPGLLCPRGGCFRRGGCGGPCIQPSHVPRGYCINSGRMIPKLKTTSEHYGVTLQEWLHFHRRPGMPAASDGGAMASRGARISDPSHTKATCPLCSSP